jgi:hypothetical protein
MNSIKQKPSSQATGSSAGQEILRVLWNKNVHPNPNKPIPKCPILFISEPI